MNKKGFTLIELLAVIVILAIIALIATPIVLNIISDARDSSDERSVEFYGDAVEKAIVRAKMKGIPISRRYTSSDDGKTLTPSDATDNSRDLVVDYSGQNIKCDSIYIHENGNVYIGECHIGDNIVKHVKSYGDLNNDGYVDGIDASIILQYLGGKTLTAEQLLAADVNLDNVVDKLDSCVIMTFVAGFNYNTSEPTITLPYTGDPPDCSDSDE